jgi:hypothetical protein
MVMYLIYPAFARRNIRKFLFVIEVFNLINYVYGIIIASSEGNFYVGEIGNLIGIDSYDVYVRKYFNVIPTFRIVALIIVTMTIWNNIPIEEDNFNSDKSDFEAKLYKTLYGYSKCVTETIYIFFNVIKNLVVWICYALIFLILIINDHSIKNWILAILIMIIIYKHLSTGVYYLNYFATCAGFVFITTWVYQFLKFDMIKSMLGIEDVKHIPFHGEFWGYTVLSDQQLLFRVVALSSMLVLSVIGYRTVKARATQLSPSINANDAETIRQMDDASIVNYALKQKEEIFWSSMSIFWPVINFIATFFHVFVILTVVYQSLFWKLSWTMMIYLFFLIGPWYRLDLNFLQTVNLGKDKHLTFYSNFEVRSRRYKVWKTLMWITMIAWIIIFPSQKFLKQCEIEVRTKAIFYGEWVGILYPNTTSDISFWNYVSGYMAILTVLVLEKKFLEWLAEEDIREHSKKYQETVGERDSNKNYIILSNEIERRRARIEDRKLTKVGFAGIDEDDKIDLKEKLRKELDDVVSILNNSKKKKKEETKNANPPTILKSAMKSNKRINPIAGFEDGPKGPKPFDKIMESENEYSEGMDDDFNKIFTRDDPNRDETRKLLLFQYKIKFMRGAKTFAEESMTFALLICALYKDNILSLVYYWMSIKMILENVDMKYRMKVAFYVSVFSIFQYFL